MSHQQTNPKSTILRSHLDWNHIWSLDGKTWFYNFKNFKLRLVLGGVNQCNSVLVAPPPTLGASFCYFSKTQKSPFFHINFTLHNL
jgi:hypothetical protein